MTIVSCFGHTDEFAVAGDSLLALLDVACGNPARRWPDQESMVEVADMVDAVFGTGWRRTVDETWEFIPCAGADCSAEIPVGCDVDELCADCAADPT